MNFAEVMEEKKDNGAVIEMTQVWSLGTVKPTFAQFVEEPHELEFPQVTAGPEDCSSAAQI